MRIITIIVLLVMLSALAAKKVSLPKGPDDFFKDGYCKQTTAKTAVTGDKTVTAYVDGEWHDYKLATFPKAFMDWNIQRRLEYMETIRKLYKHESEDGPELAGPHNGMVATYGFAGQKSQFKLNNAVKGMGFLPRADKIDSVMAKLTETAEINPIDKLDILESMYNNAANIFDLDKQVSLELYAEPKFLTQSYTNQMINPVSTIVFLDIPSYKLKTIARLLDPKDPNLTPYEKKVVKYINMIHSYFHGAFDQEFIATVYNVVEIYDNSPGRMDARGLMIVP